MKIKTLKNNIHLDRHSHSLSMRFDDMDEAQSFLSENFMPLRVASLARTSFDLKSMAVQCGGLNFSTSMSRSGVRFFIDKPVDGYGMTFLPSGVLSVDKNTKHAIDSPSNGGLILDSLTAESATFSPDSMWHRIALTSDDLSRHMTLLTDQPVRRRIKFTPQFNLGTGVSCAMLEICRTIVGGMSGSAPLAAAPAALVSLKEAVLSLVVEAMPHDYSAYLGRRVALLTPRHVRRAIDFMHANLMQPLRLEDIAVVSQTSARSLQTAFRQFRNTTPMDYLRRLRLDGAREELMRCPPGTRVAEVAYRWGFAHHGMFAVRYAKLFGESPSMTLRNHRKA